MPNTENIIYVIHDPESLPVHAYHDYREAEAFIKSKKGEWSIYEVKIIKYNNPLPVASNLAFEQGIFVE